MLKLMSVESVMPSLGTKEKTFGGQKPWSKEKETPPPGSTRGPPLEITWAPRGNQEGPPWKSRGPPGAITWAHRGNHEGPQGQSRGPQGQSRGPPGAITWAPRGNHVGPPWKSRRPPGAITWAPWAITWAPRGNHVGPQGKSRGPAGAITWAPRGNHVRSLTMETWVRLCLTLSPLRGYSPSNFIRSGSERAFGTEGREGKGNGKAPLYTTLVTDSLRRERTKINSNGPQT